MASNRYVLSSLTNMATSHRLNPDHFIGFRFAPTNEELISIVNKKNARKDLHPMFTVYEDLFGRPPEPLEECYCFTKLELVGGTKVNRTLRDVTGPRHWKNINSDFVRDDNDKVIGWVTNLRLHWRKNKRPTEWHIRAYSDRKTPVAGRYVLCHVYKLEKKNDSGRGDENQAQCSNTQPDGASIAATNPQDALVNNSQQFPYSCPNPIDDFIPQLSQGSSMWASDAREDMNQVPGQCSNTQPDWVSIAATNPQDALVYNSQQFSSCPNPIVDFVPQLSQGSSMWASDAREDTNQVLGQCSNTQPDSVSIAATNPQDTLVYNSQQFPYSCPNPIDDFIPQLSQGSSMWASDAREDMNQVEYYEMGPCSNTQPNWFSNAATNPDLTGGHMNQDQIPGEEQSLYTPQAGVGYNSHPARTQSMVFPMDSWNEIFNQSWPQF